MKRIANHLLSILMMVVFFAACTSFGGNETATSRSETATASSPKNATTNQAKRLPLFTGDGGKGIVIAGPAPHDEGRYQRR
jgi:hypothetical protein